jgi:hypothetical protein
MRASSLRARRATIWVIKWENGRVGGSLWDQVKKTTAHSFDLSKIILCNLTKVKATKEDARMTVNNEG